MADIIHIPRRYHWSKLIQTICLHALQWFLISLRPLVPRQYSLTLTGPPKEAPSAAPTESPRTQPKVDRPKKGALFPTDTRFLTAKPTQTFCFKRKLFKHRNIPGIHYPLPKTKPISSHLRNTCRCCKRRFHCSLPLRLLHPKGGTSRMSRTTFETAHFKHCAIVSQADAVY